MTKKNSKVKSEADDLRKEYPFELLVGKHKNNEVKITLIQTDHTKTSHLKKNKPVMISRIWGNALHLMYGELEEMVKHNDLRPTMLRKPQDEPLILNEASGVRLGLIMMSIKPLKRPDKIKAVLEGFQNMSYEEVCYWYAKCRSTERIKGMKAIRTLLG